MAQFKQGHKNCSTYYSIANPLGFAKIPIFRVDHPDEGIFKIRFYLTKDSLDYNELDNAAKLAK